IQDTLRRPLQVSVAMRVEGAFALGFPTILDTVEIPPKSVDWVSNPLSLLAYREPSAGIVPHLSLIKLLGFRLIERFPLFGRHRFFHGYWFHFRTSSNTKCVFPPQNKKATGAEAIIPMATNLETECAFLRKSTERAVVLRAGHWLEQTHPNAQSFDFGT